MSTGEITYGEALDELRNIHARISSDDVDIEMLLDDVKRASELLEFCQKRITSIGEQLEEVLADFSDPEG